MAVYWQAVSVYAKHLARALRRGATVPGRAKIPVEQD